MNNHQERFQVPGSRFQVPGSRREEEVPGF